METQSNLNSQTQEGMFLKFLETAIKNAAEPILTKLFEDSHRNQKKLEMGEEPIDIDEAALLIKKKKNTVLNIAAKIPLCFTSRAIRHFFTVPSY